MATSLINIECKRYGCMKNLLACYANCRFNTRCEELRGEVLGNQAQATADINAYRASRGAAPIEIQSLKRGLKFVDLTAAQKATKVAATSRVKPAPVPLRRVNAERSTATEILEAPSPPAAKTVRRAARQTGARVLKTPAAVKHAAPVAEKPMQKPGKKKRAKRRASTITRAETKTIMARKANAKTTEQRTTTERFTTAPAVAQDGVVETRNARPSGSEPRRKRSPRKSVAGSQKKAKKTFIILNGDRATVVDEQGLISQLLAGSSNGARFFEVKEVEARLEISYKR